MLESILYTISQSTSLLSLLQCSLTSSRSNLLVLLFRHSGRQSHFIGLFLLRLRPDNHFCSCPPYHHCGCSSHHNSHHPNFNNQRRYISCNIRRISRYLGCCVGRLGPHYSSSRHYHSAGFHHNPPGFSDDSAGIYNYSAGSDYGIHYDTPTPWYHFYQDNDSSVARYDFCDLLDNYPPRIDVACLFDNHSTRCHLYSTRKHGSAAACDYDVARHHYHSTVNNLCDTDEFCHTKCYTILHRVGLFHPDSDFASEHYSHNSTRPNSRYHTDCASPH